MATYFRMFDAGEQWLDASGDPYSGGKLYLDDAGTSTNRTSYKDNAGSVAHTNPIVLDSSGRIPSGNNAWVVAGDVKVILHDSADVLIFTQDDYVAQGDNSAAGDGEWVASDLVPTRTANTIFTLPGDNTAIFHVGRRLKLVDSTTVYATITVSAYTTLTTLTVVVDGGTALTASLASLSYSLLNADNTSDPGRPRNLTMVNDGATIKFGADQDVTLTHVHNTGLNLSSAGIINTEVEVISANSGGTAGPTFTLSRDSANPAVSDSLGQVIFNGKNDADPAEDVTYASITTSLLDETDGTEDGQLTFKVMRAGTLANAIALKEDEVELNATTIDINGNIVIPDNGYIGSTSDTDAIRISGAGLLTLPGSTTYLGGTTYGVQVANGALRSQGSTNNSSKYAIYCANSDNTRTFYVRNDGLISTGNDGNSPYYNTTGTAANMFVNSSGSLYRSTSSARFKTNVESIEDAWADKILDMQPIYYKSIATGDVGVMPENWTHYGFSAEQVATVDPRLVSFKTHEYHMEGEEGDEEVATELDEPIADGVQYVKMIPGLVNLIKRQRDEISALTARVLALET